MKKLLYVIYALCIVLLFKISCSVIINSFLIKQYNQQTYSLQTAEKLLMINIYQPYIAHYNYGNILYQKEMYEEAEKQYRKALKYSIPQKKICSVRINLSLSLLAQIKDTESEIDILIQLQQARQVLYQDDCAHEKDNKGKNQQAESLEEQIREQESNYQNATSKDDEKEKETPKENQDTKDKEEILKKRQNESQKERQEDLETAENFGNYNYYNGKTW